MPGPTIPLRFTQPGPLDVSHVFKAFLIRSPLSSRLRSSTRYSLALHAFRVLPLTTDTPQLPALASLAVCREHCCPRCGFRGLLPVGSGSDLAIRTYPRGCSALQGFHLSRSCFAASSKLPAFRFYGSQALSPRLSWLAIGQSQSPGLHLTSGAVAAAPLELSARNFTRSGWTLLSMSLGVRLFILTFH